MPEPFPQSTLEQVPALNTWLTFAQAMQALAPPPEQLEHDESHVLHVRELASKYSDLAHVCIHRPPVVRTGAEAGQDEHWLKPGPVQVRQSGWHGVQVSCEAKLLEGQVETQVPAEASWLFLQIRQKSALLVQVARPEAQGVQVKPSEPTKVPSGQLPEHFPPDKNWPGIHLEHLTSVA